MERTVVVNSTELLSCACVPAAQVILCVESGLVTPSVCQDDVATYEYNFLEAVIECSGKARSSNCDIVYSYEVTYDDSLLVSYDEETQQATTPLVTTDISGIFCQSCLTDYIQIENGQGVSLTVDGNTITLVNQYGCEYAVDVELALVIGVLDTPSVDLTLAGTDLSADVILSADADNIITEEVDGLKSDGIDTVVDTNSIDLTKTVNTLSADVKVSADGGNSLQERADGMYASTTGFTVDDTDTVDMDLTATVVTANVVRDPDADNVITESAAGLKVSLDALLDAMWPVHSVYTSYTSANPSTQGLPGTWITISSGRVLVGYDAGDFSFNFTGKTGGSKTVDLNHQHDTAMGFDGTDFFGREVSAGDKTPFYGGDIGTDDRVTYTRADVSAVSSNGSYRTAKTDDQLNNGESVMNPYFTVHFWRRIA